MAIRYDRNGQLAKPIRRGDAVVFEGRLARTGPMSYGDEVEDRDAAGLADVAATVVGRPVTLGHPNGLVADGAAAHVIGTVESARIESGHVIASMRIDDPGAVAAIESGTRELSIGYQRRLDAQGFQRSIQVDHVALVTRARCGPSCAVRSDGSCGCGCENADADLSAAQRKELSGSDFAVPARRLLPIHDAAHVRAAMARFGQASFKSADEKRAAFKAIVRRAKALDIDSSGFERRWAGRMDAADHDAPAPEIVMDELKEAIEKAATEKARADAAEKERDALKAEIDKVKAERSTEKARADEAEKSLEAEKKARADAESPARRRAMLKALQALETGAKLLGLEQARIDSIDDEIEMKRAAAKLDADADEAYVRAAFDIQVKAAADKADKTQRTDEQLANLGKRTVEARTDGSESIEQVRASHLSRLIDGHRRYMTGKGA